MDTRPRRRFVLIIPLFWAMLFGLLLALIAAPVNAKRTLAPSPASNIISDDFNACELNTDLWMWIDPQQGTVGESSYQVAGDQLAIFVPGGSEHGIVTGTHQAPSIMQSVSNEDFAVQARFTSSITTGIQNQGILATEDMDDFIRIYFQHDETNVNFVAERASGGGVNTFWSSPLGPGAGQGPVYLRVTRNGNQWQAQYSFDGFEWIGDDNFRFDDSLTLATIGVFAGNAAPAPAHTMYVDYFFNEEFPILPEDSMILRFEDLDMSMDPVSPPLAGAIEGGPLNPTPGNPECGSPLRISAIPEDGWAFDMWEVRGASTYTSASNPLVSSFTVGDSVRAEFKQVLRLSIGVDGEGEGKVIPVPAQTAYNPGQNVELTALPAAGSSFANWSGDAPAGKKTQNPLTIVMDENKVITATFNIITYTLTITVKGNGEVVKEPDQDSYPAGQSVTLTAKPALDWLFVRWVGDVAANEAKEQEITVAMGGDREITAVFENRTYLPIVTSD